VRSVCCTGFISSVLHENQLRQVFDLNSRHPPHDFAGDLSANAVGDSGVHGLREEHHEHGQGIREGKQKGKSDKRNTKSKARQKEALNCVSSTSGVYTLLHKRPDMHYVKHKLVKNTLPSHHVKHDDTRVPPNCRSAEKQAVSRHPGWLDLSLKRVLSVEFVELSP
jgi:hypothetical protein